MEIKKEIESYKKFAFNQNMIQVAVGILILTAFQKTVSAISDFLIMPIVNYFVNATNGNWRDWKLIPLKGMNIELGHLLGSLLDFAILTLIVYLIYTHIFKRIWKDMEDKELKETVYVKRNEDGKWKVI